MTVHRLHAGDGYTYLTRQVAAADHERPAGERLTDYYTANGTPPGQWHGRGAEALGVSGEVSEAQMGALFGEGLHPDADAIITARIAGGDTAAAAVGAAKLGRAFPSFAAVAAPVQAELAAQVAAFRAENGRSPDRTERNRLRDTAAREVFTRTHHRAPADSEVAGLLGGEKRTRAQPVAGFDLVFTPQKSVSLLWGLGSDEVRRTVESVHDQAVSATLAWVEAEAGRTRRGAGGVRQIDTEGLVVARFDHYDNRTGDPNLHTHATVSNKVLGADGRWSALDARVLYAVGMAGAARYNAIVVAGLRRELGVAFTDRSRGPGKAAVQEVAGITDAVVADFSRRADIVARTEELTAQYRACHGHRPGRVAQLQLAQQAVLDTRSAKAAPRSLAAMREDWATQAAAHTAGEVPADWVDRLLAAHRRTPPPVVVFDPAEVAAAAVATVSRRRATWTEANLRTAVEDAVSRHPFDTPQAAREAVEQVVTVARDEASVRLTVDPDGPAPGTAARLDGSSVYTVHAQARFTSTAVLDAERDLVDAAHTPTTVFVPGAAVTAAIEAAETASGTTLNEGQRGIATHLATSGQVLAVAVGPAGTGKTTALSALVRAWTDDGRQVIPLADTAAAARVLGGDLGVPAQTVAKLLTTEGLRDQEGVGSAVAAGVMLLVDEAGMTATADLKALVDLAAERGAVVRLVGDPYQLSAVESGGALRLLAADTRAPELTDVVRFTDPAEAAAGLAVRAGDAAAAWAFYTDRGRVVAGAGEVLRQQVLTQHLADTAAGTRSLMLAATTADVAALNLAAHQARVEAGTVDPGGPRVRLRDGLAAHVGDTVVTRHNTPDVRVVGGSRDADPVTNGDLWTVTGVHPDGALTLRGTTHRGTVTAPADYVAEHVELGYAATVHRAQGMTVDRAHILMSPALTRSTAYVGLTRGREANHLYLVTDEEVTDTHEGHHHPAGGTTEPALDPEQVFTRIVGRTDDNLTATQTLAAELDHADDTTRLRAIHADLVTTLAADRAGYLLDRALPATHLLDAQACPHYPDLVATLAAADTDGLDTRALVTAITTVHAGQLAADPAADLGADPDAVPDSLTGARDTAAVLRARADTWIGVHTTHRDAVTAGAQRPGGFRALRDLPTNPNQLAPIPARHPGMDTARADYTTALGERIGRLEAAAATPMPAGRAQLEAVMRAARVQMIPSHTLDRMLLTLRGRQAAQRGDAALPEPTAAATVATEHARLPAQIAAISAARAAQARAGAATAAAAVALHARTQAENAAKRAPLLGRRRAANELVAATAAERAARDERWDAEGAAVAAVNATVRAGAPQHMWEQVEAHAADGPGRAGELAAARAADAEVRGRRAAAAAALPVTERQLRGGENERARRGALTPEIAALEAEIRGEEPVAPPPVRSRGNYTAWEDTGWEAVEETHTQQRGHSREL